MRVKIESATALRTKSRISTFAFLVCILAAATILSCKSEREEPSTRKVEQRAEPIYDAAACSVDYPNGGFYPKDPRQLQDLVDKCLKEAGTQDVPGEPVAVVSPHAGYMFSAPVAAYSYKALENLEPETVILVGPSHIYRGPAGAGLKGASILTEGSFRNSLGALSIDSEIARKIVAADPKLFRNEPLAFRGTARSEHSLEVQLPFLQRVLKKEFKIVMILVNDEDVSLSDKLGKAIADACAGKKVILIASSDLTHRPPYSDACEIDQETIKSFLTLDPGKILKRSEELMRRDVPQLECTACGLAAVMTVFSAARKLGADSIKLLKYANSGDTYPPSKDSVVGYGALVLYRAAGGGFISPKGQKTLLSIARESITAALEGRPFKPKEGEGELAARRGVFVTLLINGQLRGCKGCFDSLYEEPLPTLPKTIAQVALSSAFQDTTRFQPVTKQEIPKIKIRISILSPLVPVDSVDKIVLGKHGILIQDSRGRGATFLPEVATEQGWNLQTLLTECCIKGHMAPDAWKKPDTKIFVYTTQVFGEE
jgi:hypothetical protein